MTRTCGYHIKQHPDHDKVYITWVTPEEQECQFYTSLDCLIAKADREKR